MTEKANPSVNRPAGSFETAGAIAYSGGFSDGWISPSGSPSEISVQDADISESNLDAFAENSSSSSLTVDISGGEAFVFGSWLAIDTTTSVSLSSSTNGQTVFVGWNKDGTDDVIVGTSSDFSSASGNTDQKIPLFNFDTDGSGVTNVTDRRTIGQQEAEASNTSEYQKFEGGTVEAGSYVPLQTFELRDQETLYLTNATLTQDAISTAAPSGINLVFTQQGASSPTTTVLSGDGTTFFGDVRGTPLYSYTNTSGSNQVFVIAINNGDLGQSGTGSDQIAHGGFTARII